MDNVMFAVCDALCDELLFPRSGMLGRVRTSFSPEQSLYGGKGGGGRWYSQVYITQDFLNTRYSSTKMFENQFGQGDFWNHFSTQALFKVYFASVYV